MQLKRSTSSHLSISSTDILAQISEAVVATDWNNQVLFWNLAAERKYGVSAESMIGQSLELAYRSDWLNGHDAQSFRKSLTESGKWSGESIHVLRDGRTALVELDTYVLRDDEGQEIGSIAIIHDATAERQDELQEIAASQRAREEAHKQWVELRDNGGVLENFLENLPIPAYVKDEQGRLIFFNDAAKAISPVMLAGKGRTDEELFGSEAARHYRENDIAVLASGKPIRIIEVVPSDDQERSYLSVKFPLADSRGNRFVGGVSVDITDSIRDQAELRKQAALLDSANDAIFVSDLNGKITYWNQGAERLYGWSASEAIDQNETDLLRAQFPLPQQEMLALLLREGHWEGDVTRHDRSGQPHTVSSRWSLLRDLHGNPVARMVINTDLTEMRIAFDELRRAEAEAQARATELAAILDAMPAATFIAHDPECKTMTSSRAAYEILRLPHGSNTSQSAIPSEAPTNFRVFENGRELAAADLPVQRAAATGKPVYNAEVTIAFDSGANRRLFGSAVPLLDAKGSVRGALGTFIDISERLKSEEQLTLSENRYRCLAEASSTLVWTLNAQGQPNSHNPALREYLGIPSGLTFEQAADFIVHPDDLQPALTTWKQHLTSGKVFEIEHRIRRFDGQYRLMAVKAVPVRDVAGKIVEWVGTYTDITESRIAESALRTSQAQFRTLFESDLIGIGLPEISGGFKDANDELLRIVGYNRADLASGRVRWDHMTPSEFKEIDTLRIGECLDRGSCTPYEKTYIRKDGTLVPVLVAFALLEGSRDNFIGFVLDISAQKQAQAALQEREQRFRALAESLPQLVWTADGRGIKSYVNQRYLEYTGLASIAAIDARWQDVVHPDDREAASAAWKHSVATGEPYQAEYRLLRSDGVYRSFLARAIPLRNNAGEVIRWLGSSTDVHDQKLVEEAMRRSEKLETAGRLAANIAHEINNPLASVTNALYLAMQDESLSDSARDYLRIADQELARVAQVTTQTLQFHKQSTGATPAILSEIMDATFSIFASRLDALAITVERQYLTRQSLVCFTGDIRQVFAGLLSNALDAIHDAMLVAMPNGGRIRVRVRTARCAKTGENGLRVLVADNGKGIPSALRTRVFEPFISTKEATGTGLGLWVAECILRKHNGRITLYSSTDARRHGTVFALFFPFKGVSE